MNVNIAFFTGTGCTQYVAEMMQHELEARNHSVQMLNLGKNKPEKNAPCDLLIVCYVVHASNAPKPVMTWVHEMEKAEKIPTAIISVSGGGEVTPNLACRLYLKRKLNRKNYSVFYEKMVVMPSNWIVSTKPVIINALLNILPYKVSYFVEDIINRKKCLYHPGIGNRLIAWISQLEHLGSRIFGKSIRVSDSCNACGLCAKHCPVGNIEIIHGTPVFSSSCTMCLNCLYVCPQQALSPGMGKKLLIEEGFNFQSMLRNKSRNVDFDIKKETKGYLWLGVQRYLLNTGETLEPCYKAKEY